MNGATQRPDMFDLRVEREQAARKELRAKLDGGVRLVTFKVTPYEIEEYRKETYEADRMMGGDQ